jgi:hypothetical protein
MDNFILFALLIPCILFNLYLFQACKKLTVAKNFFEGMCAGLRKKLDQEREDSINLTLPVTKEHASRFMSAWNTWRAKE